MCGKFESETLTTSRSFTMFEKSGGGNVYLDVSTVVCVEENVTNAKGDKEVIIHAVSGGKRFTLAVQGELDEVVKRICGFEEEEEK